MARCGLCGAENSPDARFCQKCGKAIGGTATIPGKCARCGYINVLDAKKCEGCGAPISDTGPQGAPQPGMCWWCGKPALPGQETCQDCSHMRQGSPSMGAVRARSDAVTAAAVLLVIAGALTLIQGVYMTPFESMFLEEDGSSSSSYACCGFLEVVFGIVAIASGYFAYKRSNFALVVAGCMAAIAGIALLLLGPVLGVVALILVVMNRKDF